MPELSFSAEQASIAIEWEGDGSGDFLMSVEVRADEFRGHADGHVAGADFRRFAKALEDLERNRKGAATLESALPGEFTVTVKAIDGVGHMGVLGVLRYCRPGREWPQQELNFAFEFDPSQLHAAVGAANAA